MTKKKNNMTNTQKWKKTNKKFNNIVQFIILMVITNGWASVFTDSDPILTQKVLMWIAFER